MIAISGVFSASIFVGASGALSTGGPALLVIGYYYRCDGCVTMYALGEPTVLYPVNGAFFT
jgi:amino acid transporter